MYKGFSMKIFRECDRLVAKMTKYLLDDNEIPDYMEAAIEQVALDYHTNSESLRRAIVEYENEHQNKLAYAWGKLGF
jgi:hypothetical protein